MQLQSSLQSSSAGTVVTNTDDDDDETLISLVMNIDRSR
jgi:hypothetical protein